MNDYLRNKLREGRSNCGLKQSDVAKMIGVKGNTLSNYENGVSEPDIDTFCSLCDIYGLDPAEILGEAYGLNVQGTDFDIKPSEIEHIKKYRSLDDYGQETINITLSRETSRVQAITALQSHIAELESSAPKIIDIEEHKEHLDSRLLEYHRSVSAGGGVFILGDEDVEQVGIPDVPGADEGDYAIKISGNSMEPDYYDGEVALVARDAPIRYGDVGIFIIDGKAYIKEYGKTELISRNPKSGNIIISEYANIVCMGKVVGKIREEDMIRL